MQIEIKESNKIEESDVVRYNLRTINRKKCDWLKINSPVNALKGVDKHNWIAYNNDGNMIGGLLGHIEYNWYFLDMLYIDENYRGQHIATMLMESAESLAKEKQLSGLRLETWDFQAKGLYEKLGYEVYAVLEDCPPGTINYFMKKIVL